MANIHIRGLDERMLSRLKLIANERGISVNKLILSMLHEKLDLDKSDTKSIYHDLDHLAATWAREDVAEFTKIVQDFELIDAAS